MNRSRASEANKHKLDVCKALIARGGLVKHVVHRGNSFLYVCLPALFDLYMQRHGVFIPSFTAYARTLSSELVLQDRTHTQRFPPHYHKAAAVTFRWPADRQDLPAADELAELLHLNEKPPQEAVSGTESGKITWGRARIQAKPRACYQQQQQQAAAGVSAGGSAVGAAVDGAARLNANGRVDTNGPAAPTAAVPDAFVPSSNAAVDQRAQQDQHASGRPGSTSSSSSSLLGGKKQQQEQAPSAAAAAVVPGADASAAASGGAAVVQESPFFSKRGRDDTPEQQQQHQQVHDEQRPAKQPKQMPASNGPGQVTNMLTSPRSSVAVVSQQQQQQHQSPPTQQVTVQRQHTPKQQQALGPGSHLVNQQKPKQQQQQQRTQAIPSRSLPLGMQVQRLQQLQQQPSWLPYQLPPLPPQQQQQQQPRQQLLSPTKPIVKRLPAGMRVGSMSHQERLQLLSWLLKGRPERMQQLKVQQQGATADADGGPSRKQQGMQTVHGQSGKMANPQQQQQQQALSASQVQMLQASLRKRQHELAQQQQASALRNGLLAAAGFAKVKSEVDAAAGQAATTKQQQQQQDEEEGFQRVSTTEAQQEVERLQQELQQLQSLLLNQGQGQHEQKQLEQPAVATQQESRKRKSPEDATQQQQEGMPLNNGCVQQQQQLVAGKEHRSSPGQLSPAVLTAAERAEVQALLTAMCAVSGAADVQQLVAGIDIQLRSGSSKEQQQEGAGGCDCTAGIANAAAAGVKTEQQQQQHQQHQQQEQQASDMDIEVLRELRSLALAFGQQRLRVPSLFDLAQDMPCLLEGVTALDGQHLLCLSETQLQGFLAAVGCSELPHAVHAVQQAGHHHHQQQQQPQNTVKVRAGDAAAAAGSNSSSLAQLQQELAAELMSSYKTGCCEVLIRPHTLMLLTGQRLMAAAQQVTQLSPLQQTPLAAAVAGCLAEREAQLLRRREQGAAVTGLHLLNAFLLRNKFDLKLAGQRQLVLDMPAQCAVLAAAGGASSQLRLSTVSAAVFAYPLLQEQQMLTAEAEEASSAVLSSWLFVAPQLRAWQQLVFGLKRLKRRQQSQQQQQGSAGLEQNQGTGDLSRNSQHSFDHKQQQQQEEDARQLTSLQECRVQAEKLLQDLQLQPQDIAWLQQHLNTAPAPAPAAPACANAKKESMPQAEASSKPQQQQQQQQVAVSLQQKAGQAVLTKPGWVHVVVSHAANVKVRMEFVGPADVAACAAAQHELQQGVGSSSSSGGEELGGTQLGPVVLTLLQQWCAYCRQQELQLQQQ